MYCTIKNCDIIKNILSDSNNASYSSAPYLLSFLERSGVKQGYAIKVVSARQYISIGLLVGDGSAWC
jgi:hypothetical protein